jgi:PIN domain nuclease of toxin-antitoxin system
MRVLLDTHAWLWFVLGDTSLSSAARAAIEDKTNQKLISPASYWELAIKISIGKYLLPESYETFMTRAVDGQGFKVLPILPAHTSRVARLPFHHRDPFDRLLVGQALAEDLTLISNDGALDAYGARRLW